MVINRIMCTSRILTDLCFTKQRIKTKNTFAKVVYNVLVVKICLQKKISRSRSCSFANKLVCIDDRFTRPIVVLDVKMLLINLLK